MCLFKRFQSGLHKSGASGSLVHKQTLLSLTLHKIDGVLKVLDLQRGTRYSPFKGPPGLIYHEINEIMSYL